MLLPESVAEHHHARARGWISFFVPEEPAHGGRHTESLPETGRHQTRFDQAGGVSGAGRQAATHVCADAVQQVRLRGD